MRVGRPAEHGPWWLASLAAPLHRAFFFFLSGVRGSGAGRVFHLSEVVVLLQVHAGCQDKEPLMCWQGNERNAALRKLPRGCMCCLVLR